MKRILLLLFLFLVIRSSFAQGLKGKISAVLNQEGKEVPSDQLFLHLDRNLYHAGDTIRFQAYIRDSRTGDFTTESSAMYALLLNSENVTADSARFRIMYSSVSGWLRVPDDAPAGDYSILAFTSLDMNYSPDYAFSVPVKIDNYISGQAGMKIRGPEVRDTQSGPPPQLPQPELRFLPEGGTFVSGIRQRLAFNAVRADGTELLVSGMILNQRDERIASFKSTPYGPGVVEFTPAAGDSYFAFVDGEEFREVKWSLPFAENSGISLQVLNDGNGWDDIILRGRGVADKSWFLTVTLNNILVFSDNIRLDTLCRKRILTGKLPAGTAYVTLYDSDLNPVAERLIFMNDFKKMDVRVEISGASVFRGEETELTIGTRDCYGNSISSVISVSVIDSASGYCNAIAMPEIESAWLYDKEFYSNLPFSIKSQGIQSIDRSSVDILLMTYGWRSFHPKEISIDDTVKPISDFDFVKIVNPGAARKCRSEINLISDANVDLITLPIDKEREAVLYFDSLDINAREIMILPDKDPVRNSSAVNILFPSNTDYMDFGKQLIKYRQYQNPVQAYTTGSPTNYDNGSVIVIEPVTIKAPKQASEKYEDKHARMFQSTGASTYYRKDFGPSFTLEDILYRYNPYKLITNSMILGTQPKQIFLRNTASSVSAHTGIVDNKPGVIVDQKEHPALIVLDNNIIGNSYEPIANMPSSDIASVTFLRGVQGVPMYGVRAIGGVVFITSVIGSGYTGEELSGMNRETRKDDLLKQVRIFRTETEYYIPTKEEAVHFPEFQYRPTLLWKGDVVTGESGTIKITYPNNITKGTAMIFVNGISSGNRVGSGRYSYKVE